MRRQFTTIVVLLSIITVLAVAVATVWLLPIWSRMDADTRFDWNRWHWIWLITAYLTGWAYLVAVAIFQWASRLESP